MLFAQMTEDKNRDSAAEKALTDALLHLYQEHGRDLAEFFRSASHAPQQQPQDQTTALNELREINRR